MNSPDILTVARRRFPSELKHNGGSAAQIQFFNLRHDLGMTLFWRGERTEGAGVMKGPAYLERGILPVVPIAGQLTPIPLSWILPHDDDSESESDG